MKPPPAPPAATALRQAAEARLKANPAPRRRLSEVDLQELQHELEVRQIELEIQQEELQAALAEAEGFRAAMDEVHACVYMKDTQSRYTYANRPTLALFGCAAETLVGSDNAQFFPPDTVKRLREIDARVFRGEQTVEEIDIPDAIGGRRVFWEVQTPIYADAEHRAVCGLLGISTDITERKLMEETLEHSQRLLAESEKMGRVGSWELDTVTRQVTWTDTVYAIHDLDPACPLTLEQAFHFYTPACRPIIERVVRRAMEQGEPYDLELQIVTAKGHKRDIHTIGHADLAHHKVFGFFQDITVQKQAEQKLRESQQKLFKIFQSSPVAISLSTVREGRLLEVNEAYLRMLERTRQEVIGRTSFELGLWVDPAQRTRILDQLNQQSAVRNFELDLRAKSGGVRHVLLSGEELVLRGKRCLLSSMLDITERKRTEIELQRSERALRAMSACGQALVHAATEGQLLEQICRAIVELGGYRMAWVGFPENNETETFRVAAVAGHEAGYLAEVRISWSEAEERGRGPTGRAFRTGQRIICQDLQTDPIFAPWRAEAARRGYASSIALPLRDAASTFGIVMIYAAETNAFQPAEVALLTAMSEDLAYGLQALRTRLQHQQAEAALTASETRFRAIFHSNAVGTAILEPDSTVSLVSDVYCQLTGYTRPELIGKCWHQWVAPADLERLIDYNRRRLRNEPGVPAQYEFRFIHKNGEVRHCQIAVALIPSSGQVIASMLDITESKRVEESHARLATAIEQAAETVVITDTQGVILYANPAFERSTGYTRAEALGQNPRVLKSGKHDAGFYRQLWDTLRRGEVWTGHFVNKRKDGTLYEEEATISPIRDANGATINYVAVKRDVTHEVQLEAQVRQTQKMEAIGTLAGGIAHDFNNMLGAMFGYAHLLQQDTEGNPLAQESVAEILRAANRAKDLVQQILTFSRQREQKPQIIKLDTIVKEAIKFLRASLPAHIQIEMELSAEAPAVLADPTQIYQVTMNLATNALHAMEDGPGRLMVGLDAYQPEAKLLHAHPQLKPMRYARLTVADTGHGMDAKTLERIFEPFFTTKPVGKGTGLGLAVVHGIMESHSGVITVESQVGQGTTFHLYFPAETKAETLSPAAAGAVPRGHGQRVLVLDDETALTAVLQIMLRRLGYQAAASNHASEAIRLYRENPTGFDLVITDLTMPEMNGLDVARQLRAIRPNLPVILVSGHSVSADADRLRAAGICERLDKPVSLAALAEAVARALKTKPGLNPNSEIRSPEIRKKSQAPKSELEGGCENPPALFP